MIGSGPRLLAAAGADADEAARAAGIDPGRFQEPTFPIRFVDMGRYFAACIWASHDDRFPLRLGLAEGPSALDAIGYLAQHSPDVRSSFDTLRSYVHHFAGAISIRRHRGLAVFEYSFLYPRIEGASLITEAAIGLSLAVLRKLCGPAWSPVLVRLVRPLPPRPVAWRRCIQAPVEFGAERNAIHFSARWLDQPIEQADRELHRILHERVVEVEALRGAALPVRVGAVIRASLLAGDVRLHEVAGRLATSSRTLTRRLEAHGTTFEALLDQTRFDVACQLLDVPGVSMTKIADLLGYAHSSALSRAFRRWSGMSPREWCAERAGRRG
jgi:AraC-like DNA-binding protein